MIIATVGGATAVGNAGNAEGRLTAFDGAYGWRCRVAEEHQIVQNRLGIGIRANVRNTNNGVVVVVIDRNRHRAVARNHNVVDSGIVGDI